MNVKREATGRLKLILAQIAKAGGKVNLIPLTDYADEATHNFLIPSPGWSFLEWQAVNNEVASQLRERGFKVVLVKVELTEYFDFLARYDLPNTTQNRAQFVSWKLAPDDAKPLPLRN